MIATLIAGMALAVAQATPETPPPPAPVADAKPPAPAAADADSHIRKALAFEARGLPQGRARELKAALAAAPDSPIARGLLGLVDYAGTLKSPEEVAAAVKADADLTAKLAEYNTRRAIAPEKVQPQYQLALWCEQNGLPAEARAHFTAVTRIEPNHADAWKHLGCKKFNGRWLTPAAIDDARQEALVQKQANRHWSTLLAKWKVQLRQKTKHDEASARLNGLDDPRAVPAVWAGFVTPSVEDQTLAVQLLGQIDTASASVALATMAVYSQHAEVRRIARETLVQRDPRDYMDALIAQVRKPLVITGVKRPEKPGDAGILLVEGAAFNVRQIYQTEAVLLNGAQAAALEIPPGYTPKELAWMASAKPFASTGESPLHALAQASGDPGQFASNLTRSNPTAHATTPATAAGASPALSSQPNQAAIFSPSIDADLRIAPAPQFVPMESEMVRGLRNTAIYNIGEADRAFLVTQKQMMDDVDRIGAYNASLSEVNEQATSVLRGLSKKDFGNDPDAWKTWLSDQQGYAYRTSDEPKPTIDLYAVTETPDFIVHRGSCFAAGTAVRTREGSRPIETVRVGDLVLSQNPKTGALGYQPVLKVAHNRPAPTLKVRLDGNKTIVATPIHRFWKVGKGWKMARELEPGDLLRINNGTAYVAAIDDDKVQPVFNLEVSVNHSFFAGDVGALVHDDSLVNTVFTPFDAEAPALASAAKAR